MNIDNATSVLNQASNILSAYKELGKFDQKWVNEPGIAQLNPALDCVWQVATTSPLYQRTPDWVPSESKVKTSLCILKAIQYQIANGTIECKKLYNPGYLEALEETRKIFETIDISILAYGKTDYPDLDQDSRNQLIAVLQAATHLLKVTKSLFGQ